MKPRLILLRRRLAALSAVLFALAPWTPLQAAPAPIGSGRPSPTAPEQQAVDAMAQKALQAETCAALVMADAESKPTIDDNERGAMTYWIGLVSLTEARSGRSTAAINRHLDELRIQGAEWLKSSVMADELQDCVTPKRPGG